MMKKWHTFGKKTQKQRIFAKRRITIKRNSELQLCNTRRFYVTNTLGHKGGKNESHETN